jgi:hypothetical protein
MFPRRSIVSKTVKLVYSIRGSSGNVSIFPHETNARREKTTITRQILIFIDIS